jgi:2-C-methyl-D-erythritol 4-phosphate cytidylyltransferase
MDNARDNFAIIVAGGSSSRFGKVTPKQFSLVNGLPIIAYSLKTFYEAVPAIKIILVLAESHFQTWEDLVIKHSIHIPHSVVAGGAERFFSVKNALESISKNNFHPHTQQLVAIHDAARPLVSVSLIREAFRLATQTGSAVPVVDVLYSLRKLNAAGSKAVKRSDYKIVQTPQVFNLELLSASYNQNYSPLFTDDASVYEAAGNTVTLFEGEPQNIKITTQEDMDWIVWKMKE